MPKTLTMIDPRPNGSGGQYERGQTYTLADDLADYFLSIGVARYPTLQQTHVLADRDPATGEVSTIGTGRDTLGTPVLAVTSPGGVVASRIVPVQSIGGRAQITRDYLLERFQLPVNHNIADRSNIDLANATLPAGCTAEWVDAHDEFGGKSLKISFDATTPANAHVILPLLPDFRGNFPKARPRLEWRVMSSNFQTLNRLYLNAAEDVGSTKKYLWVASDNSSGKSQFGLKGPYTDSVNGRYRTIVTTPYSNVTAVSAPSAWGETSPEYTIRAISVNVILAEVGGVKIPGDLYINRVSSPEWACGALITQMDGGYELSRLPIFHEFWTRGWPGVVSRLYADQGDYIPDEYWPDFVRAGWDVCQHVAKQDTTAMDATVTEQVLDKIVQDFKRFAVALGIQGPGLRTCSNLTNEAPILADAASVLRRNGITGGRGQWSDESFGIDPRSALVEQNSDIQTLPRWVGSAMGTVQQVLSRCRERRDLLGAKHIRGV